jgi:hypothetical protein
MFTCITVFYAGFASIIYIKTLVEISKHSVNCIVLGTEI